MFLLRVVAAAAAERKPPAHAIGSGGTVTAEEGELYRGIAAAIDCPLPPLAAA